MAINASNPSTPELNTFTNVTLPLVNVFSSGIEGLLALMDQAW